MGRVANPIVEPIFDEGLSVTELIFQALGAASMCWEFPERAGVFNSDRAKRIGEEVLERLAGLTEEKD